MPGSPAIESAPSPTLEDLMSRYQQADDQAATALIEKVTPLLQRYFLMQASNRRYSDDLVQDTWIRVHQARHTYRRGDSVLPWVFAIARHTGLDHYRRTKRVEIRETQVDVLPDVAAPTAREENQGPDIATMLADLPQSQRDVLVMLKVTGMSLDEVAKATSSSIGSVKQKAHRAYTRLREALARKEKGT